MEESLEVSDALNHKSFSSNDDGLKDDEMQDIFVDSAHAADVLCDNKATAETVTPEAGPAENVEQVNMAALPASNASAETNDADENIQTTAVDTSDAVDINQHSDAEQPSVNANSSVQQSHEQKNLDLSGTSFDDEPELAMNQAQQKFGIIHPLDRPANVVIDLRSPPLVQVCLLHGADDIGAGGSGSSGVHQRPQTARRGHRRHRAVSGRTTNATRSGVERTSLSDSDVHPSVMNVPSSQTVASNGKQHCSVGEKSTAELSTIIHLKVVDTPDDALISGPSHLSPANASAAFNSKLRLCRSDGDHGSESSDDGMMRVRNVNRTYSRNPSISAAQKNPRLITTAKFTDYRDGKKCSEGLSDSNAGTASRHAQGFKSVPRKSTKTKKRQLRIGPAWFSRRFLNTPPPEIWECARTSKALKMLKRPNYDAGVRHWPIVVSPPSIKQLFEVPVVEEAEIATIGREELRLSRLSEDDVEELQSQLRHEAEHRRSEHIMPLVMEMTDAQIEHAYERVAESMKTYEIVEADSDEDEDVVEAEENGEEIVEPCENGDHLESSDWSFYDTIGVKGLGDTEYARLRPKRHAVDYGPSAFTPIMIMEGRRLLPNQRKRGRVSQTRSGDTDKQRCSHGHKSRRWKRKKNRVTEQMEEIQVETPAGKCANDTEELTGYYNIWLLQNFVEEFLL